MKSNKQQPRLPKGWTLEQIERVRKYYDSQTADEAAAEDDALFDGSGGKMIMVPMRLVPQVRKMIAKVAAKPAQTRRWRTKKPAMRS